MTGPLLRFRPLYGAQSHGPCAHLLELGPAAILLDCGWEEPFDVGVLEPLLRELPRLDLVLLSQPGTAHVGALPYLVGRAGLAAPVYAAAPVAKLGSIFMYDSYIALEAVSDFTAFTPDDIDPAFAAVRSLKHRQAVQLELKGVKLSIEGLPAGHMVGGTIWVLRCGGEAIVYGPISNHIKERHLNGGQLAAVRRARSTAAAASGSSRTSCARCSNAAAARCCPSTRPAACLSCCSCWTACGRAKSFPTRWRCSAACRRARCTRPPGCSNG